MRIRKWWRIDQTQKAEPPLADSCADGHYQLNRVEPKVYTGNKQMIAVQRTIDLILQYLHEEKNWQSFKCYYFIYYINIDISSLHFLIRSCSFQIPTSLLFDLYRVFYCISRLCCLLQLMFTVFLFYCFSTYIESTFSALLIF